MNSKQRIDDLDELLVEAPFVLRVVAAQPARGALGRCRAAERGQRRRPRAPARPGRSLPCASPRAASGEEVERAPGVGAPPRARAGAGAAPAQRRPAPVLGARCLSMSRRSRRARSRCAACRSTLMPRPPATPGRSGSARAAAQLRDEVLDGLERSSAAGSRPPRSGAVQSIVTPLRSHGTASGGRRARPSRAPAPSAAPNSGAGTGSGTLPGQPQQPAERDAALARHVHRAARPAAGRPPRARRPHPRRARTGAAGRTRAASARPAGAGSA